jgi:hypothetical protein
MRLRMAQAARREEPSMPIKVLTVEEANLLVPKVETLIRRLQELVVRIVATQDAVSVLALLGAEEPANAEHRTMAQRREELEELVGMYNQGLEELQSIGCVVKDIDHGVVDFYGLKEGRLIFLCWRMGEQAIRFWHEINAGMAGRRPVSEL